MRQVVRKGQGELAAKAGTPCIIIIGPTPPPRHGVSVMVEFLLKDLAHRGRPFAHVNTSDGRSLAHIGRPDAYDAFLFVRQWLVLLRRVVKHRSIVYLPISQTTAGVFRDCLFLMVPFVLGVPYVFHLHGGDFRQWLEGSAAPMRRWVRLLLGRARTAIVLDPSFRLIFEGLVAPENIAVVSNGVPDPRAGPVEKRTPRSSPALEVAYIGFLSPGKGVDVLVSAAGRVLEQFPTARFTLAGNWPAGGFRQRLEAMPALTKCSGRIQFVGPVEKEDKRELLERATIFVFPGVQQEGQPLVLLEAMSYGLPIVCTDTGCNAATVGPDAALIVRRGDPEDLADKICRSLADPAWRARAGAAARARYDGRFRLCAHLQQMSAVLLAAASGQKHTCVDPERSP